MNMGWIYLIAAGVTEVIWAVGLKSTHGFTTVWPIVWTLAVALLSFILLALAMKTLPLGMSYTVSTGIGVVGTVLYGMFRYGESRDLPHILCIVLIVVGIIGLKWLGGVDAI